MFCINKASGKVEPILTRMLYCYPSVFCRQSLLEEFRGRTENCCVVVSSLEWHFGYLSFWVFLENRGQWLIQWPFIFPSS